MAVAIDGVVSAGSTREWGVEVAKRVFLSYSHADERLLDRLRKHLAQLQREGSIEGWYDRDIHAGDRLDDEISRQLEAADIFVACASPDYIASTYCYERELTRALQREAAGDMAIVPVIFEPSDWLSTPLAKFKAIPKDGKSVAEFTNQNIAFLEVATELRRVALEAKQGAIETKASEIASAGAAGQSRYRVKREHDELHKRDFVDAAFQEIFRFFEASASEISAVPDIEVRLSALEGDHFSCTIINRGIKRGFETLHVRRGGSFSAIDIVYGDANRRSTSNGGFGVEADEYQLYLKPLMFSQMRRQERTSPRDAAQMLWDDLISKVGIDYV